TQGTKRVVFCLSRPLRMSSRSSRHFAGVVAKRTEPGPPLPRSRSRGAYVRSLRMAEIGDGSDAAVQLAGTRSVHLSRSRHAALATVILTSLIVQIALLITRSTDV